MVRALAARAPRLDRERRAHKCQAAARAGAEREASTGRGFLGSPVQGKLRHVPPPRIGSGPTLSFATVQKRLERAMDELARTDVPRPPTPGLGWTPPSAIDKDEAATAKSPLARQAWSAGSKLWGDKAVVGGGGTWTDTLYEKPNLSRQDLQNLQNQALRVLAGLVPPGTDPIPREALADLPAKVDAYWKQTFGERRGLMPAQRDALVALIRAAIDGE